LCGDTRQHKFTNNKNRNTSKNKTTTPPREKKTQHTKKKRNRTLQRSANSERKRDTKKIGARAKFVLCGVLVDGVGAVRIAHRKTAAESLQGNQKHPVATAWHRNSHCSHYITSYTGVANAECGSSNYCPLAKKIVNIVKSQSPNLRAASVVLAWWGGGGKKKKTQKNPKNLITNLNLPSANDTKQRKCQSTMTHDKYKKRILHISQIKHIIDSKKYYKRHKLTPVGKWGWVGSTGHARVNGERRVLGPTLSHNYHSYQKLDKYQQFVKQNYPKLFTNQYVSQTPPLSERTFEAHILYPVGHHSILKNLHFYNKKCGEGGVW